MNESGSQRRFQFSLRGLFVFVAVVSVVLAVVAVARKRQRETMQVSCINRVKQIGLGLQGYHDANNCFPPAYIADANGKPMHSWRVLVLPFSCEYYLYRQYVFSEAWNGPNNRMIDRMISGSMLDEYRCPAAGDHNPTATSYVAVVGEQTMFPGTEPLSIREVINHDGSSNTIMLLELADSDIHWMEPQDLTFDEAVAAFEGRPGAPELRDHPGGVVVGFADGSVRVLSREFLRDHGKAMLTRAGGEKIPWPE